MLALLLLPLLINKISLHTSLWSCPGVPRWDNSFATPIPTRNIFAQIFHQPCHLPLLLLFLLLLLVFPRILHHFLGKPAKIFSLSQFFSRFAPLSLPPPPLSPLTKVEPVPTMHATQKFLLLPPAPPPPRLLLLFLPQKRDRRHGLWTWIAFLPSLILPLAHTAVSHAVRWVLYYRMSKQKLTTEQKNLDPGIWLLQFSNMSSDGRGKDQKKLLCLRFFFLPETSYKHVPTHSHTRTVIEVFDDTRWEISFKKHSLCLSLWSFCNFSHFAKLAKKTRTARDISERWKITQFRKKKPSVVIINFRRSFAAN